jgi:hydroxymethylpyrimidine/phosphomethylpyrimidine kinase
MSPKCLTIAGSDTTGGAGIQADLRTFAHFGAHGVSAVTAITAQTGKGVMGVYPIPADVITQQLSAIVADGGADAIKVGMIGSAANVRAITWFLASLAAKHVVVDPIFHSTSGAELLEAGGIRPFRDQLLPFATVITPNADEAGQLTGMRVWNVGTMKEAARQIYNDVWSLRRDKIKTLNILVKGGHVTGDAIDVLYDGKNFREFHGERIDGTKHGTGCLLSSAITAGLALGKDIEQAVKEAKQYVERYLTGHP